MARAFRVIQVSLIAGCLAAVSAAPSPKPDARGTKRDDVPGVLLSRQLMEQSGVRVGDIVTMAADAQGTRATRFLVAGSYEPTPDPLKFSARRLEARLHLPDLVTLTEDPGDPLTGESISALNLKLVDVRDVESVASTLATRVPGLTARPTATPPDQGETFAVISRFHLAIAIVTILGSTAFLLALMVIRAEERRDIVGILRLMGIPPRSILAEVLIEGFLVAVAGACFGILVAVAGEGAINRFFQWRYDTTLLFVRVTLPIAVKSIAFAVPLGVLAGLIASWTILRRDVMSLIGR